DQILWLKRLLIEYDNLRSALEWCLETPGRGETALELATALLWFWIKRAYVFEGRKWLDQALTAGSAASSRLQAKALNLYGMLTISQGDHPAASSVLARGLALARQAGDQAEVAFSLGMQGLVALYSGEVAQAANLAVASRAAAIESGELWRQGPA